MCTPTTCLLADRDKSGEDRHAETNVLQGMDMLLELLLPVYARLNESGWLLWFVFHDVYEAVEMSTEESVHTRVINFPDILSTQQMRQGPSQIRTPLVMLLM
ncbi:hypothetical protein WN66_06165 [Saccharomyces cerevisiae]|nr:hypothetical protein WN66_06165 [Saccharomyces cerevisiae]